MNYFYIYLLVINLIGFAVFGIDKYKACHGQWRISEKNLFRIAFLGGGVGCLTGMYTFRHKTKHLRFTIGIPLIILLELTALVLGYFVMI